MKKTHRPFEWWEYFFIPPFRAWFLVLPVVHYRWRNEQQFSASAICRTVFTTDLGFYNKKMNGLMLKLKNVPCPTT
jgi:hypothetical protein